RLSDALESLPKLGRIRTCSGAIRRNADAIDREADTLQSTLNRLLLQARTALAGTGLAAVNDSAPTPDSYATSEHGAA
ncbi:MAG: hypothetical protein WAR57_11100, partial [Candidatus Phosphoribacter sp.]